MITSPNGQGVILLGCESDPKSLYELTKTNGGELIWRKMVQELKYPRSYTLAMLVPDDLVTCKIWKKNFFGLNHVPVIGDWKWIVW